MSLAKFLPITPEQEELLWEKKHLSLDSSSGLLQAVIFYLIKCFGLWQGKFVRLLTTNHVTFGEDELGNFVAIDVPSVTKSGRIVKRYDDPDNPRSIYKIIKIYHGYLANEGPFLVRPISSIKEYVCYSPWPIGIGGIDQTVSNLMKEIGCHESYTNCSVSLLSVEILKNIGIGCHCIGTWTLRLCFKSAKAFFKDAVKSCTKVNCEEKNQQVCLLVSRLLDPPYPPESAMLLAERRHVGDLFKNKTIHSIPPLNTQAFNSWLGNIKTEPMEFNEEVVYQNTEELAQSSCTTFSQQSTLGSSHKVRVNTKLNKSNAANSSASPGNKSLSKKNDFKIVAVKSISEKDFCVQENGRENSSVAGVSKHSDPSHVGKRKVPSSGQDLNDEPALQSKIPKLEPGEETTNPETEKSHFIGRQIKEEINEDLVDDLPVTFIKSEVTDPTEDEGYNCSNEFNATDEYNATSCCNDYDATGCSNECDTAGCSNEYDASDVSIKQEVISNDDLVEEADLEHEDLDENTLLSSKVIHDSKSSLVLGHDFVLEDCKKEGITPGGIAHITPKSKRGNINDLSSDSAPGENDNHDDCADLSQVGVQSHVGTVTLTPGKNGSIRQVRGDNTASTHMHTEPVVDTEDSADSLTGTEPILSNTIKHGSTTSLNNQPSTSVKILCKNTLESMNNQTDCSLPYSDTSDSNLNSKISLACSSDYIPTKQNFQNEISNSSAIPCKVPKQNFKKSTRSRPGLRLKRNQISHYLKRKQLQHLTPYISALKSKSFPTTSSSSEPIPPPASLLDSERINMVTKSGIYYFKSDHGMQVTNQVLEIKEENNSRRITISDIPCVNPSLPQARSDTAKSSESPPSEFKFGNYFPEGTMIPASGLKLLTKCGPNGLEVVLKFDFCKDS
ncbi:uncharacterized protein LOC131950643 [Physella acuta]|uniref:uncharacterized protein LOC131950643 n=1 Tax=Physella acuta TaxID=109671 RepID=UPI0027DAF7E2|nr:uncharacterized protein LOC131950643 [Physella acuta]